jgi:hypothetical protein
VSRNRFVTHADTYKNTSNSNLLQREFKFRDLFGEIRNRIYEYALMELEGLHYHHVGNELTASPDRKQYTKKKRWRGHANQLKFTCRQIWHETRGLGLSSIPSTSTARMGSTLSRASKPRNFSTTPVRTASTDLSAHFLVIPPQFV